MTFNELILISPQEFFWGFLACFVGAFPTGVLIARLAGIPDITQCGSGTMGATNVGRHLGIGYFFLILLIDAGKAAVLMQVIPTYIQQLAILMLMYGNTYLPLIGSSGGKGVATLLGILIAFDIKLAAFFIIVWASILWLVRSVGIASSCALGILAVAIFFLLSNKILACRIAFAALWSLCMHKNHIKKLVYSRLA